MNKEIASSFATPPGVAFEKHYTVQEVSKLWGYGVDVIRRLFRDDPDVIKVAHPETLHKRGYTTLRNPESSLRRVHKKLTTTGKPI